MHVHLKDKEIHFFHKLLIKFFDLTLALFFSFKNDRKRLSKATINPGNFIICMPFCLIGYASCCNVACFLIVTGLLKTKKCLRVAVDASTTTVTPDTTKSSSSIIKASYIIVMLFMRSSALISSGSKAPGRAKK